MRPPGLFKAEYPACWKAESSCSSGLIQSVTYTQISGIIVGMVTMGFIADVFGRKNGSRITSAIMLVGAILLTASAGTSDSSQFTMYTTSLVIFGYGVGVRFPFPCATLFLLKLCTVLWVHFRL